LTTFTLPWVELSCGDKIVYTQRGDQVAVGKMSPTDDLDALARKHGAIPLTNPDDPTERAQATVAAAHWAWAFPLGALLLLIAGALWRARPALSGPLGGAGAALCTLTLLAALTIRLPLEAEINARIPPQAAADSPIRVRKAYGFFIALLASLSGALAASYAASSASPDPQRATPPHA
jgi:hypothetical protein